MNTWSIGKLARIGLPAVAALALALAACGGPEVTIPPTRTPLPPAAGGTEPAPTATEEEHTPEGLLLFREAGCAACHG